VYTTVINNAECYTWIECFVAVATSTRCSESEAILLVASPAISKPQSSAICTGQAATDIDNNRLEALTVIESRPRLQLIVSIAPVNRLLPATTGQLSRRRSRLCGQCCKLNCRRRGSFSPGAAGEGSAKQPRQTV